MLTVIQGDCLRDKCKPSIDKYQLKSSAKIAMPLYAQLSSNYDARQVKYKNRWQDYDNVKYFRRIIR